ncbi:hypothetical protein Hanom_Chr02g00176461 [Helianthus anomalus]
MHSGAALEVASMHNGAALEVASTRNGVASDVASMHSGAGLKVGSSTSFELTLGGDCSIFIQLSVLTASTWKFTSNCETDPLPSLFGVLASEILSFETKVTGFDISVDISTGISVDVGEFDASSVVLHSSRMEAIFYG